MVGKALVLGRIRVYLCHSVSIRLHEQEAVNGLAASLQVVVNDLARLLLRRRRSDSQKDGMKLRTILDKAGIPSINEMAIIESGMMAWTAFQGGVLHKDFSDLSADSRTRSAADLKLRIPPDSSKAMMNAVRVWNQCDALRSAKSRGAATMKTKQRRRDTTL